MTLVPTWRICENVGLPRVRYGVRFTGEYAGDFSFSTNGLAWGAAVFDFLAVFLSNCCHGSAFDVKLIGY